MKISPRFMMRILYIRVDSSGDRPHSGLTNNQIGIELHAFYGRRKGIHPKDIIHTSQFL